MVSAVDSNDENDAPMNASTSPLTTVTGDTNSINSTTTTSASTPTVADTAYCSVCSTLQSCIEKLEKKLALKSRLLAELRKRHKAFGQKIRKLSKEKVAFGSAVKTFLNIDQQKSLCRTSNRGSKWTSATVKNALQLHFACGH